MMKELINLPNTLTLIRLVLSPLFLPLLFVYLLPFNIFWLNCALAFLFVLFGLTDFFDGYFARRYQQVTSIGKMLDPIADKFLVYSTLIALLAIGKIYFYWVVILIGRDFFVMGLRQVALENNFSVAVSGYGKLKTAFQMLFITFVLVNPHKDLMMSAFAWNMIEYCLLAGTLILTVFSAKTYYHSFMNKYLLVIENEQADY